MALFSDLLRAWHGDLPWLELARRAEQGLAALLDAGGQSQDDGGEVVEPRQSSPPLDTDEVSLQDIADAEARIVKRQVAFRSAADALESLHGQPLAQWPDLVHHPAAQGQTAELAELLLENSTRCLADDPRLAAAFAALAGLIRTRGPEHDERPADREQVRILASLAKAASAEEERKSQAY